MTGTLLPSETDISGLEQLLFRDGRMVPCGYADLKNFSQVQITVFCHKHAIYQIITTELLDFIKGEIWELLPPVYDYYTPQVKAIEIGAGNGCLGRALGIPITDSCLQEMNIIKQHYLNLGQPVIQYPKDIVRMGGNKAVKEYRPDIVIGSWITGKQSNNCYTIAGVHGINEKDFIGRIKKYIHIGNEAAHADKELLELLPHTVHKFPWLISKAMDRSKNLIYIFNCEQ